MLEKLKFQWWIYQYNNENSLERKAMLFLNHKKALIYMNQGIFFFFLNIYASIYNNSC